LFHAPLVARYAKKTLVSDTLKSVRNAALVKRLKFNGQMGNESNVGNDLDHQ